MFTSKQIGLALSSLFFILCYVVFSFGLTAPNLVLTTWPPYWEFQSWIWRELFNNRQLLTLLYTALISGLWLSYGLLLLLSKMSKQHYIVLSIFLSLPLLLASTALSYDIFNYIFNAKMVSVYGANPHVQTALEFAQDPWMRFMHNTHTPAPYGYGWTVVSLLPFAVGLGKFLPTWIFFKVTSWLGFMALVLLYAKTVSSKEWFKAALVVLNPLVLIEIVGNSHNDLWMLVPAVLALWLIASPDTLRKNFGLRLAISLGLLCFSIFIKLATIVLLPLWLVLIFQKQFKHLFSGVKFLSQALTFSLYHWGWLASILLFVPLLTERSKWFLPWYITWSLVWIPFMARPKSKLLQKVQVFWQIAIVSLSVSSLYRYLPFLWQGNYDGAVDIQQITITWLGGVALTLIGWIWYVQKK